LVDILNLNLERTFNKDIGGPGGLSFDVRWCRPLL